MRHYVRAVLFSFVVLGLSLAALIPGVFAQTNAGEEINEEDFVTVTNEGIVELPRVHATDLRVAKDASGSLGGSFTLTNNGEAAIAGIQYQVQILGALPEAASGTAIEDTAPEFDRYNDSQVYSLTAGESKDISFAYTPPLLPEGEYRVRVQLVTSNDRELGWDTVPVSLDGADAFAVMLRGAVDATSVDVFTGEERTRWAPEEGVNVDPGQDIALIAETQNVGSASLAVTPTIEVTRSLVTGATPTKITGESVTLAPGRVQNISIPITAETQPGAYSLVVTLHDAQDNRVSGIGEYRYVVRGASASILSSQLTGYGVNSGDTVSLDVKVAGPADLTTEVQGTVDVAVLSDANVVGQASVPVTLSATVQGLMPNITLDSAVTGVFGVRITVNGNGSTLDTYEQQYPDIEVSAASGLKEAFPSQANDTNYFGLSAVWLWVIGIVVLIIIIGVVVMMMKGRSDDSGSGGTPPVVPPVAVLLLAAGLLTTIFFLSQGAPADANGIQYLDQRINQSFYGGNPVTATLFVNLPHGAQAAPSPFRYQARLRWAGCDNVVNAGALDVYTQSGQTDFAPTTNPLTLEGDINSFDSTAGWTHQGGYTARDTLAQELFGWRGFNVVLGIDTTPYESDPWFTVWSAGRTFFAGRQYALIYDFTWLRPKVAECKDGINNDAAEDTLIDLEDPGCYGPDDEDEANPTADIKVNGQDTTLTVAEGDSVTVSWVSNDTVRCNTATSTGAQWPGNTEKPVAGSEVIIPTESQTFLIHCAETATSALVPGDAVSVQVVPAAQCDNDEDDDSDGQIDCSDPGCWADANDSSTCNPDDDNENDEPRCADGEDNDDDGLIDCGDPGCWADPNDSSTCDPDDEDEDGEPNCNDGDDDDGDGLIDCSDPGCWVDVNDSSTCDPDGDDGGDGTETDSECSDGDDNDNDGQIDCSDPGCWAEADNPNSCDENRISESHVPGFVPPGFQEVE